MKKIYSLIPLLVFALIGCDSSTEPSLSSEEFFPLQVGNKWFYNSSYPDSNSADFVWEVVREENFDGKQYFAITEHNLKNNFISVLYYRFNGDTLFVRWTNFETILADFSLNINDTAYWQNGLAVVQKTKDIMKFETPHGADYGFALSFKRGIGITSLIQNGIVFHRKTLLKAEIN